MVGIGERTPTASPVEASPVEASPIEASNERPLTDRPETKTGTRRRVTLGPPREAPEKTPAENADPKRSGARQKRPDPLRVDEVRASRTTMRGAVETMPRIVDASRIVQAPIDSRHAFLLQLIDGRSTMTELVDASGFREEEVEAIVARLERLGIIAR